MNIASLHVYPLKSGRVIDLATAGVTDWGLAGDRRYMVVDENGYFVTQRELQTLARVRAVTKEETLHLAFSEGGTVQADFDPQRRVDVEIWGSRVTASIASDEVNDTLSKWLGRPLRLVHADRQTERACSSEWAGEGVSTGFSDGYPILVTTTASLDALNAATREARGELFGMERFRPNIVIEHDVPFADDHWAAIEIAGIRFDFVKPCARCIMTTQDQTTGDRGGPDPMPAMRQLRMSADRRVPGVLFGWNVVARGTGTLATGDAVTVIETRSERWPLRQR